MQNNSELIESKLALLLCFCSKFNSSFFSMLIKKYEKGTVATRHFFRFHIVLHEPDDKFAVKRVWFEFVDLPNSILNVALQSHNKEILMDEVEKIHKSVEKKIKITTDELVGVLSIASLIKTYANFKYVFVPVIIDYGRGSNMSHQTGLLVDYSGKFIFYEPYGKYVKHDKSYAECVCDFFEVFKFGSFEKFESITYHKWLGLSDGIQNIILTKNNARASEFEKLYNTLVKDINKIMPYKESRKKDEKDKTFKILELLENLDNLGGTTPEFVSLVNRALEQYYYYNSKTCVSISLVEMNELFKSTHNKDSFEVTAEKIKKLHAEFDIAEPNTVLMRKLGALMDVFENKDEIIAFVNKNYSSRKICSSMF